MRLANLSNWQNALKNISNLKNSLKILWFYSNSNFNVQKLFSLSISWTMLSIVPQWIQVQRVQRGEFVGFQFAFSYAESVLDFLMFCKFSDAFLMSRHRHKNFPQCTDLSYEEVMQLYSKKKLECKTCKTFYDFAAWRMESSSHDILRQSFGCSFADRIYHR